MLPHDVGVVSHKPTILHPAGQSEVQVHPDVVVQGAVIGRGVETERAIPVCHFPLYNPAFVDEGTTLFNLPCGGRAYDIIQPNVPVSSVVRVVGIDDLALDTTEQVNNILALNWSGLGALLRDSHHSFVPQDGVCRFYGLRVSAHLQVLVVLVSGNEVSFSRVAPGHVLDTTKVRRVVIGVRWPFQIRDM